MRRLLSLLPLALLLTLAAVPVQAQTALLGGWERLGDSPREISGLAFAPQATDPDGDPVVWASDSDLWRLDPSPGGGPGTWTEVRHLQSARDLLLLPAGAPEPDTLVIVYSSIRRSLDGGETFTAVHSGFGDDLAEAPPGSPHAGALFEANAGGAAVSTDRGATWTDADPFPQMLSVLAILPLRSGRVVAAGIGGVVLSDDGGVSYAPSPTLYQHLRYGVYAAGVLTGPGGVERVVVGMGENSVSGETVRVSDDEGETWRVTWAVPAEVGSSQEFVALSAGGGGQSGLFLTTLGAVYRTDDGGETWGWVGAVPCVAEDTASSTSVYVAALGPDGRLYVGCQRQGPEEPWSYRTAAPVIVAAEPAPVPEGGGLTLAVEPNPSSGSVALVLTLPTAEARVRVAVYDGIGREVAAAHEGPLGAGTHRLTLDTGRLAPGVYVARVTVGGAAATARLALTR